jgi:hypothetical protein
MKNIIILGPGRTGSSLLSGLISHNRFYIQREEVQSRIGYPDGDYEAPELVRLNKGIFFESGYNYHKIESDKPVDVSAIENLINNNDTVEKCKNFVIKCEQNSPWLWKDPRLCHTIYFWKHLIDLKNINFIFITRDRFKVFKSYSKFRIVYTKKEVYKNYDEQVMSVEKFLKSNKLDVLRIDYGELGDKQKLIKKLNSFLATDIMLKDFDYILKTNIKKKEPDTAFWIRYYLGATKLKLDRFVEKSF